MQPGALPVAAAEPLPALFRVVSPVADAAPDLRGLAHDLGNKLTIIVGSCELLQSPNIDQAKVSRYAANIHKAAMTCADIARAMLAPQGKPVGKRASVDLHQVILEELAPVAGEMLRKGINLHVERVSGRPLVRVDAVDLARVLANLVDNARDALLADALIARPHAPKIDVSTARSGAGEILLSVADNGPGIPQEYHARIWRQGFSTKDAATGGSRGYGLDVVRRCVEDAGGRVELQSTPGQGTRFELFLPAA